MNSLDRSRDVLNTMDRGVRLVSIAAKMAPEGSALQDLLKYAYCELAGGMEDLALNVGLEYDLPGLDC